MASTKPSAGPEGAAVWGSAVRRWLGPVDVTLRDPAFAARLGAVDLGYVRLLSLETGPLRIGRGPRTPAGGPGGRLVLLRAVSGATAVHQEGRGGRVPPGDLALLDLGRPFVMEQRERSLVQLLRVPGRALGDSAAAARRLTGRPIAGGEGVAALLGPLLTALAEDTAGSVVPVGDRLGGHLADLVATLVDEVARHDAAERPAPDRHPLVAAVHRYIDAHLRDPDLTPERVARAHGISVRYLHRLFEDEETTVRRLIQRRRVQECARELRRHGPSGPAISAVAQTWGFRNPAHFSRLFKSVHGHAPRHWLRTPSAHPADRAVA
ncbi:helix-turn-helix domain-containing protein [Streptomyces sp. NPDC015131]|uniref:helix-turn-helix domain-containing protein n=1 Tax=Streptomyces sp. NPDC015131 TaxID=3364941 RepID=UPI0036FB9E5A